MLIREKIASIKNFSVAYQALAEYFLTDIEDLDIETSRSIGRKLRISANTVSEFCNDLGFASFNTFRAAYLKEIDFFQEYFQGNHLELPFSENESQVETAQNLSDIYQETIIAAEDILPTRNLFSAVKAIDEASKIYLINLTRINGPIIDFHDNLLTIGKTVLIENRMNFLQAYAETCEKKDCFILISEEDQPDYYALLETLKQRGISIVALTNYGESYLQEVVKVTLPIVRTTDKSGSFASILLKQSISYLFDILFANVIKSHFNYYQELRAKFSNK